MSNWEKDFIQSHRIAYLATCDEKNNPHVIPIVYVFDGKFLFSPIDKKAKKLSPGQLRRIKNIKENSSVSIVIDDYSENWEKLAWVQIRGNAEILDSGSKYQKAVRMLSEKYSQYKEMPLDDCLMIVVKVEKCLSWMAR